jgi:hypothetical protein
LEIACGSSSVSEGVGDCRSGRGLCRSLNRKKNKRKNISFSVFFPGGGTTLFLSMVDVNAYFPVLHEVAVEEEKTIRISGNAKAPYDGE